MYKVILIITYPAVFEKSGMREASHDQSRVRLHFIKHIFIKSLFLFNESAKHAEPTSADGISCGDHEDTEDRIDRPCSTHPEVEHIRHTVLRSGKDKDHDPEEQQNFSCSCFPPIITARPTGGLLLG